LFSTLGKGWAGSSPIGLNTGNTSSDDIVRLVSDYAAEGIGLTAIGMGDNFREDLIHAITMSRGGNYLFVNSGDEMVRFFKEFDFLVTPIAYDFKATIRFENFSGKLVKTYGIPSSTDEPLSELVNVRTLFLTGSGGGAILLEYEVE